MAEYAIFRRQQDVLRQTALAEKDPGKRKLTELRREIEGHDYMAITSMRLAGISRAITMSDNDGARRDEATAKTHSTLARGKRQQLADLQREMRDGARFKSAAGSNEKASPAAANGISHDGEGQGFGHRRACP